jgi:hypothetical protein
LNTSPARKPLSSGKLAPSAAPPALRFGWQRDGKAIDPTPVLVGP